MAYVTCSDCQRKKRWLYRCITPGEPIRYFCSTECIQRWKLLHEKKKV